MNYKLSKCYWVGSFSRETVPIQQKQYIQHLRLYSQIASVIHHCKEIALMGEILIYIERCKCVYKHWKFQVVIYKVL